MKIILEISFFACLNLFLFGYLHRKLVIQNISMHQQLAIYKRKKKKTKLKERDRLFWILLSKLWPDWQSTLVIVKPETVIKWNQRRFKDYWRKISKPGKKPGRPIIEKEHIEYIRFISFSG